LYATLATKNNNIEIQPGFEVVSNSSQMLLATEPLELQYWSRG